MKINIEQVKIKYGISIQEMFEYEMPENSTKCRKFFENNFPRWFLRHSHDEKIWIRGRLIEPDKSLLPPKEILWKLVFAEWLVRKANGYTPDIPF